MAKNDLSPEVLRELFSYDKESGVLSWRSPTKPDGRPRARIRDTADYQRVNVLGASRLVHRICWIIANGEIEAGMTIDHINGERMDNRLCNLRLATGAENNQNMRSARSHSKTGIPGVWQTRSKTWRARISINGKQVTIGTFPTSDEAGAAFLEAKRRLHPGCTV